jgi:hypothetical protein
MWRTVLIAVRVTFTMPFQYSFEEYADMIYVYGYCDGNSVLAVGEYQQRFPNRRVPDRRVFTRVYQALRDTGRLPGVRIATERDVNVDVNEGIVHMAQRSPRTSTRRIARRLRIPHTRVWRTLHAEGMYPYHVQRVQHLRPEDFAERLNFCEWLNGSPHLHRYIMFTDEAQFNQIFSFPMSTILPEPDIVLDPPKIPEIPLPKNWTDYTLLAILHIIALVRIIILNAAN